MRALLRNFERGPFWFDEGLQADSCFIDLDNLALEYLRPLLQGLQQLLATRCDVALHGGSVGGIDRFTRIKSEISLVAFTPSSRFRVSDSPNPLMLMIRPRSMSAAVSIP
jgi:hypothetical protein